MTESVASPAAGYVTGQMVGADIGDLDSLQAMVENVKTRGQIDVLVCNAARIPGIMPFTVLSG